MSTIVRGWLVKIVTQQVGNKATMNWVAHAGGAVKLVQLRGPKLHREGFPLAILVWLRGTIVGLIQSTTEDAILVLTRSLPIDRRSAR